MKKILFLLLSVVALSSCGNYKEYKEKRDLYVNNSAYYSSILNIIAENPDNRKFFPDYMTYTDSVHKYKSLLNDLNETNK